MLNLLNKLQLKNGSKMDENEPLMAETPRITRPKTAPGLKYNESVPEKSKISAPKMPAALFFTYSDGKVIPGQEQLYIKGLVSNETFHLFSNNLEKDGLFDILLRKPLKRKDVSPTFKIK